MSQPRISQTSFWSNHEKRVMEVLRLALLRLQNKKHLQLSQSNEEGLNTELYFCLIEANRELREQNPNHGFDHPPTAEGRNPPDADDAPDSKRKRKIPDFYWGYIDHLEPDPRRSARNFYIECKRLGAPIRKDQIFTSLYIQKGIRRFITEEHGYAMGERSAAMVGYTQNMEFEDILREIGVAANANSESISPLQLSSDGWQEEGISELGHNLERPFPISPMQLYHFWVDLRSSE